MTTQEELLTLGQQELMCSAQVGKSDHRARQEFQAQDLCQTAVWLALSIRMSSRASLISVTRIVVCWFSDSGSYSTLGSNDGGRRDFGKLTKKMF